MIVQLPEAPPATAPSQVMDNSVLRGEAFSLEHLEQHARHLASTIQLAKSPGRDRKFAARFQNNADFIRETHEATANAIRNGEPLTTDAEWLLDNFYVVEEQLREIRDDLPQHFYWELPKLTSGEPRVYALAVELILHTDSALDEETIVRFIREFQTATPLSIGEVWAVPIMLRLGLVENLRRLAEQMVATRQCRNEACRLVTTWRDSDEFAIDLSSSTNCGPLVLQLLEQLQDQGALAAAGLKRLELQLAEHRLSVHEIAQREHQRQAANQVSIGNVITSMRLISALDWMVFFERTNRAEQVLRRDPARVYPQMDIESRNRYRNAVEDLAKRTAVADFEVAELALEYSRDAEGKAQQNPEQHVGYWLVDQGRSVLESDLRYRATTRERIRRWFLRHPQITYFGAIGSLGILAMGALLLCGWAVGAPTPVLAGIVLLAILPASEFAVTLTNVLLTRWLQPRLLPKLEFKDGVPLEFTTFVVIPSLLTSRREVRSLLSHLEMHYLANSEPALRFALLTDFADSSQQHGPDDSQLLKVAVAGIRSLNARYGTGERQPFYLFHRERRWNEGEKTWMGWERKRGKLTEFNRLLRGAKDTTYVVQEGNLAELSKLRVDHKVRFVITLDADTQLPYGTARRLIGTLAHPLNRPRFDSSINRVTAGYTVLQPRVSVHLASANRTWYSRIFANSPGIDPYTTAASDVYQDLFGEGSFTGKGIYDLDAFEKTLDDAFPENQILSHDLIEGCHARVALVSDIELIDGFPARYDADARRQHRWIRGDWQIMPWLFWRVPSADGRRANRLSILSRWKILDNLRRSLTPAATLAFLLFGWFVWPTGASIWSCAAILVLAIPVFTQAAFALRGRPEGVAWRLHVQAAFANIWRSLVQTLILIASLPHHAVLWLDAVFRTLYRLLISRRRMLEWETAAAAERRLSQNRWAEVRQMWYVPIMAIVVGLLLQPSARLAALPWLVTWLISPLIVHWLNQPITVQRSTLDAEQTRWLRTTARKTWTFFETYVGETDHWLPLDNLQEYPSEKIAHRLSPTNAGLYLVSALVARDFGYISLRSLIELWERSLESLDRLERLHGHFFNWYDTLTLQPLFPRYVSTVDSGNLAACFLTIRQGIAELRASPIVSVEQWRGLQDTVRVADEACEQLHPRGARFVSQPLNELTDTIMGVGGIRESDPENLFAWQTILESLSNVPDRLRQRIESFHHSGEFPLTDVAPKVHSLIRWIENLNREWGDFFPWVGTVAQLKRAKSELNDGDFPPLPWNVSAVIQARWSELWNQLLQHQTLLTACTIERELSGGIDQLRADFTRELTGPTREEALAWLEQLATSLRHTAKNAESLDKRFREMADRIEQLALQMDFRFLFNSQRRLFAIGYNLEDGRLDRAHYDMLCSEARLASYLAIAKGDVEPRHWFQLGRHLTQTNGHAALLSWGGTMFEYLMPPVFQYDFEGSLLHQSCRVAVARQEEYGRQHGVPWGVSESAFAALAVNSDYHYRSFGVPGLGLKRGLAKDLVVSPYSTMLALEIDPALAYSNLRSLANEGGLGPWGMYDAIDFTPERVPAGRRAVVVRCYMAHHQGMSLLSMGNLLFGGCVRRRFHAHPLPHATELLLQERVPIATPRFEPHADEVAVVEIPRSDDELVSRRFIGVSTPAPRTHLLANGEFSVMLTNTGGGYARWRDIAVTRWRPDATQDSFGQFIYLRDVQSQRVWSATYQPTCAVPDAYEVLYSIDKAEFRRRDGDIESHLEVAVSPENNAEVRQLKITNHSSRTRQIEITSYAEVVLNTQAADVAHPAFQKLFIETEYIREETALLAHRRQRDSREPALWAIHALAPGNDAGDAVQYETSRQSFLGRGRTPARPNALDPGVHLTHQIGAVLDPIFAIRCTVSIRPNESATVGLTTALATSREEAISLADQYHDFRGVQRAFELAWAFNQVQLKHLHLSPAKAHLYQRLAAAVLYPDPVRRGSAAQMRTNRLGQSALWRYGISGDLPIVLIHVTKPEHLAHVRELLMAQAYWQSHGLIVDLAVINDYPGSYLDALNEQLVALFNEWPRKPDVRTPGTYLLRGAQLQAEDKALIEFAASIVLQGDLGPIAQQWQTMAAASSPAQKRPPSAEVSRTSSRSSEPRSTQRHEPASQPTSATVRQQWIQKLEFWNGFGGFALDGREYWILLTDGIHTPMPWSNVIANPSFGTLVTATGGGYTWSTNSREYKLTSWSNDPISDPPSECIYIKDEKSGELWSPIPGVLRDDGDYWIHHGQGYTRFLHSACEIDSNLLISIAPDDSVKFVRLKLRNDGSTAREVAVTYYAEWVLGVSREQTQLYLQTEIDEESGALFARNSFHPQLSEQVSFLHVLGSNRTVSGNRAEFLGRCRSVQNPEGLLAAHVSESTGIGLDPCGVVQTTVTVPAGGEVEIAFLLGSGKNAGEARALVDRYNSLAAIDDACRQTVTKWDQILESIQVATPNRALDLLVNRWLLYQTLGCRMWGRSAFYQSGGAFGFRDQLQDVMAVVYSRPDLARDHLLRAASRQFEEGDVQHWWHPPGGAGTRTRFSDDYLWLPLVVAHYIRVTGDAGVLDAAVPFLHSPPLELNEHERYEVPTVSPQTAALYEHCRRAIERGTRTGPHGLPLMGCGDWNDGMNRVGELGQGESVWVGWFQLVILREFIPLMKARGDHSTVKKLEIYAELLRKALEQHAWDGNWYLRAFFDDGTKLGSAENDECRIDSIAQTWAVFADADPTRRRRAIQAVLELLVRYDSHLVLLLTPPLDRTAADPGYIKGYLPGIRENGGQYTHPALWLVQALAELGSTRDAAAIMDLINPIRHAATYDDVLRYRVEPYVVAADVYGVPPHVGRGGWTWYTGSAAWMYRVIVESLLGFELQGKRLRMNPAIPADWPGFELRFRRGSTEWKISIQQLQSDDHGGPDTSEVELTDDGQSHEVLIRVRPRRD